MIFWHWFIRVQCGFYFRIRLFQWKRKHITEKLWTEITQINDRSKKIYKIFWKILKFLYIIKKFRIKMVLLKYCEKRICDFGEKIVFQKFMTFRSFRQVKSLVVPLLLLKNGEENNVSIKNISSFCKNLVFISCFHTFSLENKDHLKIISSYH